MCSGRKSSQQRLGTSRLPAFSSQEKGYIKGTCDFLGVGHFTTRYITQKTYPPDRGSSYYTDRDLAELVDPRWPDPGSEWLYSVPWGFRRLLNFIKVHHGVECLELPSCLMSVHPFNLLVLFLPFQLDLKCLQSLHPDNTLNI